MDWKATPQYQIGLQMAKRFSNHGARLYMVGGCVRDAQLGLPIKDIDLTTEADSSTIEKLCPGSLEVGKNFSVWIVKEQGFQFEIARFRKEGHYSDGRRPDRVEAGTFEDDWRRRDFTVNALYWDPISETLLDPAGGLTDLKSHTLRAIGRPRDRFEEDHLRILRALRFQSEQGWNLEPETAQAIRELMPKVLKLPRERIHQEHSRILNGKYFSKLVDGDHYPQFLQLIFEFEFGSSFRMLWPSSAMKQFERDRSPCGLVALGHLLFLSGVSESKIINFAENFMWPKTEIKVLKASLQVWRPFDTHQRIGRLLRRFDQPGATWGMKLFEAVVGSEALRMALAKASESRKEMPTQELIQQFQGARLGKVLELANEIWAENPELTEAQIHQYVRNREVLP